MLQATHALATHASPLPAALPAAGRTAGALGAMDLAFPGVLAGAGQAQSAPWTRRRVRRGTYLYRAGARLESLFVVNFGCFKSSLPGNDGGEQVVDFPMRGDVLGADVLAGQPCATDVLALDDCEVWALPLGEFEQAAHHAPRLRTQMYKHLLTTIRREHVHLQRVSSMRAMQRMASFLVDLSQRFAAQGYSPRAFVLRMTRAEIGSYLGLTLESVSRAFSRFQQDGIVRLHLRDVEIVNLDALSQLAEGGDDEGAATAATRH